VLEPSRPAGAPILTANLDHLRWMAAAMVVVQHCRGFILKDYSPGGGAAAKLMYVLTGFSHQAVVIFFVISGYLVGGKVLRLLKRRPTDAEARRFLVDRFSRIFIVLWPALALAGIIALVAPDALVLRTDTWAIGVGNVRADTTGPTWAAASVLLNEMAAASPGWDNPLWSLAFEWTYYMIAAGFLFAFARRRSGFGFAVIAYAVALVVLSAVTRGKILGMFPFWLAGAFASQVRGLRLPWLSTPLFLGALLASRVQVYPWPQDALVAAATAFLLADNWFREKQPAPPAGHALASFSFSLYAAHFPVVLLGVALIQKAGLLPARLDPGMRGYGLILALVALAYAVSWAFAQLTERNTGRLRDLLSPLLAGRRGRAEEPLAPDESVSAELENVAPPLAGSEAT
jgi:peptidoglycan/LPS O-acetylase OafA/YrhL